jgi:hypothetical protein
MSTIVPQMSIEKYVEFCQDFFKKQPFNDKVALTQLLSVMSYEEFNKWKNKMNEDYYSFYQPVKELAKKIRGDYDPLTNTDVEKKDPLQEKENHQFFISYREVFENVYENFFQNLPIFVQKVEDLKNENLRKAIEQSMNIKVDGKEFKAIASCDVLWSGWECDPTAWIVVDNGRNRLVASNHGSLYFEDEKFLQNKIKEYELAIEKSKELLNMLLPIVE